MIKEIHACLHLVVDVEHHEDVAVEPVLQAEGGLDLGLVVHLGVDLDQAVLLHAVDDPHEDLAREEWDLMTHKTGAEPPDLPTLGKFDQVIRDPGITEAEDEASDGNFIDNIQNIAQPHRLRLLSRDQDDNPSLDGSLIILDQR